MDGDHHGVEILKVNPSDCGLYTCTAENNIGVSNTTCCLSLSKSGQHLLEAPRFCPDLDEVVEAVKGDTVRIAARVVAGYRPAISWSVTINFLFKMKYYFVFTHKCKRIFIASCTRVFRCWLSAAIMFFEVLV